MKRPYSPPKLTKYNSVSDLPDEIRGALGSVDNKIYIPPNGGLHGLQCARCHRVFYASDVVDLNARFDKHVCKENKDTANLCH